MPNLVLTFRREVREALGEDKIHELEWDLKDEIIRKGPLKVSIGDFRATELIPLGMGFVEANELRVGVQSNATCVHAKLEFDPSAHGFDFDFRPKGDLALVSTGFDELMRIQEERDRLKETCNAVVEILLNALKTHPLLKGLGVDVVSAQALEPWAMAEYKNKLGNVYHVSDVIKQLLPLDTPLLFPGYRGETSHDSTTGYKLISVGERDGKFDLYITAHAAEMPWSSMMGYTLRLVRRYNAGPTLFAEFDARGDLVFEGIEPDSYQLYM